MSKKYRRQSPFTAMYTYTVYTAVYICFKNVKQTNIQYSYNIYKLKIVYSFRSVTICVNYIISKTINAITTQEGSRVESGRLFLHCCFIS